MDEENRKNAEETVETDKKPEHKELSSTAELISSIDEAVAEYSFSIDDILAEYGIKREEEPEPVSEPETDEPSAEDDSKNNDDEDEVDELTERLGRVAAEVRTEKEEERLREIERHVASAAEKVTEPSGDEFPAEPDQIDDNGKIHIFEEEPEEEPKKRGFFHRHKKDDEEKPKKDGAKLFGSSIDGWFGQDAEGKPNPRTRVGETSEEEFEQEIEREREQRRPRRNRKVKTEEELEQEIFTEDDAEVEEEPEEPDIPPDEAADEIVRRLGRSRLRLIGAAVVAAALLLITFAPHMGIPMPAFLSYIKMPYIYLFVCCALELAVMGLCFETTVVGVRDLVTLRPNMESVVVFANFASLLHMITIMFKPEWEGYYGYAAVSTLSMLFAAYYLRKLEVAKLKSCRAAAGMGRPYIVVAEPDIYDGETALVKYRAEKPLGFVSRLNREDYTRKVWKVVAPIVIFGSLALAAIASFANDNGHRFFWCLAAISAAGAPLGLLLPYCLCFAKAARHLYAIGEALAGYAAAESLSDAKSVVITDGDLFPPGNIALSGLKVYGGNPVDKVMIYAASLINASGAATSRPFADQLGEQASELLKVNAFKFYENGGIGGEIEKNTVLAGTASFMMRNGIRIPQDVGGKTLIFLAINLELAGVFALSYGASGAVRGGLSMLMHQQITPVFATRDFNISPAMIETKFKLSTDTVDFPKEAERLALSDPYRLFKGKISAVISREGLKHYAECVVCARNLRRAVRISTALTLLSAVLAMFFMSYLCFTGAVVVASPLNLLLYAALWLLPNFIIARWVVM